MAHSVALLDEQRSGFSRMPAANESQSSAVSWAAVIAGAFVTAALSLVLLALGTGIGLSSILLWANSGASNSVSPSTVGKGAILWLILVQLVASAVGGYLAGRLRTKWVNIHTDEVYFRDTAHGFLVWAVSLVLTAAFLVSAATSMVGGSAAPGTSAGTQSEGGNIGAHQYFVDSLFRTDLPSADRDDSPMRTEVGIILMNGVRRGELPADDKAYLAKLVTANTGVSLAEAQNRVSQIFDETRQTAEAARKAVAHSLYWLFLALLIGAFCASLAATIGGRQRDRVVAI
jgi:hypothetical protein